MCSALTLVFLLGSASAETGYNRNGTKLATPKPAGSVNPLIVGGAPHHGPHGYFTSSPPSKRAHAPVPLLGTGGPVTAFEHNWVLQWRGNGYVCGASLIDEQWAMTAAHCTKGIAASKMKVLVHRHDIKNGGADEHECAETLKIDKKFEHPDYNSVASENDIALLHLSQVHPTPHTPCGNRRRLPPPSPPHLTHLHRAHTLTSVPPAAAGRLRRLHHQGLSRRRQLQRCRYDCHRGGVGPHFRRWLGLRRAALRRPQAAHQR